MQTGKLVKTVMDLQKSTFEVMLKNMSTMQEQSGRAAQVWFERMAGLPRQSVQTMSQWMNSVIQTRRQFDSIARDSYRNWSDLYEKIASPSGGPVPSRTRVAHQPQVPVAPDIIQGPDHPREPAPARLDLTAGDATLKAHPPGEPQPEDSVSPKIIRTPEEPVEPVSLILPHTVEAARPPVGHKEVPAVPEIIRTPEKPVEPAALILPHAAAAARPPMEPKEVPEIIRTAAEPAEAVQMPLPHTEVAGESSKTSKRKKQAAPKSARKAKGKGRPKGGPREDAS